MMRKIREMTWDMHFLHLNFFVLGAIALTVFVFHRDNPKLGMDPFLLLIPAFSLMGGGIMSFLWFLLEKGEEKYQTPATVQKQEDHELTATH